jgi:hypothetical protein
MRVYLSLIVFVVVGALASEARAIIGRPLTPVSFAGAARRTVRRTAYAAPVAVGAAAAGAATVGAAAGAAAVRTALPPGCAPGVPCGGAVYQPAYSGGTVVYVPR